MPPNPDKSFKTESSSTCRDQDANARASPISRNRTAKVAASTRAVVRSSLVGRIGVLSGRTVIASDGTWVAAPMCRPWSTPKVGLGEIDDLVTAPAEHGLRHVEAEALRRFESDRGRHD